MYKKPRGSNRTRYESEDLYGDQRQTEDDDAQPGPQSTAYSASTDAYPYPPQVAYAADEAYSATINAYPYPPQVAYAAEDMSYGEERYGEPSSRRFEYDRQGRGRPRFEEEEEEEDYDSSRSARQDRPPKRSSTSHALRCTWPDCSRTFTSISQRDRHYRTIHANNGERPYECRVAGCPASVTSWTTAVKLKQHNKQWHGPYHCLQAGCSRSIPNGFGSQEELDTHTNEAHYVYEQPGSSIPTIQEQAPVYFGTSSQWRGGGQFTSASSSDQLPAAYTLSQAGEDYSSKPSATVSMPTPQGKMKSTYGNPDTSYAGNPGIPVTGPEMDSLTAGMSRTAIKENVINRNHVNSKGDDDRYKLQKPSFFKFGRVFKVSWGEPVGNDGTDISDEEIYRNKIFCKIRRFIVIKSMKGHCLCLPVLTYSGRGVTKPGVHAREHAPLYTEGRRPQLLDGEEDRGLTRNAVAVVPDRRSDELDPVSRLNYAKVYTIEYNVKVCSVGQVSKRSEWDLTQAYNEIHPPLEIRGSPPPPATFSLYSDNYTAASTNSFYSPPPPTSYHTPDASNQLYPQQGGGSGPFSDDYPPQSSEVYSGYTVQSEYSQPYTSPSEVYADEIDAAARNRRESRSDRRRR